MNAVKFTRYEIMRLFLALIGLLWSGALMIRADTHYVSLDGANESPYTNGWASAATEIQWAVDAAATAGDMVRVSNGTYNLTNQIVITNNITVQSFLGSNVTIINGNYPDYTNRCVYMTKGVLDGFTITNGRFEGSGINGGGGIRIAGGYVSNCFIYGNYCSNSSSISGGGGIFASGGIISNCTIISNTVECNGPWDSWSYNKTAGGVFMYYGGTVVASRVSGNIAFEGGGIFIYAGNDHVVSNCMIDNNLARRNGGGICLHVGRVENCVISNNTAFTNAGGAYCDRGYIKNSTIIGNVASQNYGGVYIEYITVLSNCNVMANTASNGVGGGVGIYGSYSAGTYSKKGVVDHCIIAGNVSLKSGGGIYLSNCGLINNSLIYGNTNQTGYGGGVYLYNRVSDYPHGLISCTIAGNQVGTNGGGLYVASTNNNIENCVIYSNVATNDAYDDVYIADNFDLNTNAFWYTCAPTNLAPNHGNTTNNPLFMDQGNRNYRLSANSPCINTGTNQSWMTNAVDVDGKQRIRYGVVDMGAYEFIRSGTIYGFH